MKALRHALCAAALATVLVAGSEPAHAAGEFVYPISGRLTSTYYSRRPYGNHAALDIAGPNGGAVGASRAGRVSFAGWSGGYGRLVRIDHGNGYQTYYGHLSAFRVRSGDVVAQGQTIGLEGSSGNSTGPHVHFEVRRWGSKRHLPGSRGNQVVKGAPIMGQTFAGLTPAPFSPLPTASNVARAPTSTLMPTGTRVMPTGTRAMPTMARPMPNAVATIPGFTGWVVTSSALNVRSGPGSGYAVLGSLPQGAPVVSNGASGNWRRVFFGGQPAWVYAAYLTRRPGLNAYQVLSRVVNVRTGPSDGYRKVGVGHRPEVYPALGGSGSWRNIQYDGASRWIHGDYVRPVVIP